MTAEVSMVVENDPQLSAQVEVLPPKTLEVDGHVRTRNRELSVEQAQRLARSGIRTFVLSPVSSAEVSTDQFLGLLSAYSGYFDGMGPGHPPEASVHVYGRRSDRTGGDTRIVVACILEFESLSEA
jgi:hypothetical protein